MNFADLDVQTTVSDHTGPFNWALVDKIIDQAQQAQMDDVFFYLSSQMYENIQHLEKESRMPRMAILHSRYMKQLSRKKIARRQHRSKYRRVKSRK